MSRGVLDVLVVGVRKDDEVFDAVVSPIAIDVVDVLVTQKLAPEMLLHEIPMLSDFSSVDLQLLVAPGLRALGLEAKLSELRQVGFSQTGSGAVRRGLGAVWANVKGRSAGTYQRHSEAGASHIAIVPAVAIALDVQRRAKGKK
jgi:hypothetical protein